MSGLFLLGQNGVKIRSKLGQVLTRISIQCNTKEKKGSGTMARSTWYSEGSGGYLFEDINEKWNNAKLKRLLGERRRLYGNWLKLYDQRIKRYGEDSIPSKTETLYESLMDANAEELDQVYSGWRRLL